VTIETTPAPRHLSAKSRRWWHEVTTDYELEPHHLKLLVAACECLDRWEQARKALRKHGLTYVDRFQQPKTRPEVAIERDSRIQFARLLRELDLEGEPDPTKRRRKHA
jgi:P27 family predicted phage terminase small subunit